MEKREDINKELEALGSSLSRFDKRNPHRVPEGYFETFTSSAMHRVSKIEEESGKSAEQHDGFQFHRILSRLFIPRFAMAAASLFILVFAIILWNRPQASTEEVDFTGLTNEELNAYVFTNAADFSSEDVVAYMDGIDRIVFGTEEDGEVLEDYLEEELDELLLEEWM